MSAAEVLQQIEEIKAKAKAEAEALAEADANARATAMRILDEARAERFPLEYKSLDWTDMDIRR